METENHKPTLEAVRQRIMRWRRTWPRPRSMPQDLWAAAALLPAECGVGRIAQELGLNYAKLKELAAPKGCSRLVPAPQPDPLLSQAGASHAFVELDASRFFTQQERCGTSVVLSSADGARMTSRFAHDQDVDLGVLVEAFWRRGA